MYLLLGDFSPFSMKYLRQILFRNITRVINIKVMESERQILLSERLLLIYSRRQKLRVVDISIMIRIYHIKDCCHIISRNRTFFKSFLNRVNGQNSRIIFIKGPECVSQILEIDILVQIANQKCQCFNLQSLGGPKLFESQGDFFIKSLRLILRDGEPMVLHSIVNSDPTAWVLL